MSKLTYKKSSWRWKWVPHHSCQYLMCVGGLSNLWGGEGSAHFAFPTASGSSHLLEMCLLINIQDLSHGPEHQLLVHGKPQALHSGLHPPPTHASPCTGFAALLCSVLNSSFYTPPSSGAFQQQPSPARTAMTVPFPGYISEETLHTSHPYHPVLYFWSMLGLKCRIWAFTPWIETFSGFFSPQCKWNTFIFLSMSLQSSQAKHCSIVPARGARYKHICLAALSGPLTLYKPGKVNLYIKYLLFSVCII